MSRFTVARTPQSHRGAPVPEERILFVDAEALVIDKPAGLAVHPGPRTPASLEDHLDSLRFGFLRRPTPVHRLDRDTSGCLLLARNPKAHRRFQQAFEAGAVAKTYVAILDGAVEAEEGVVEIGLRKVSTRESGWRMMPDPDGQVAVTRWRRLAVREGRTAILFSPATGRTHQLRVHAASGLGAPIAGDPVYGDGAGPMLLHALSLRMERDGKAPVEARAPLPAAFAAAGFGDVV
ncbi:MAG: tRNA pseudouridine32 synthase / rRNA pseudouridine746 synthase [Sphingomonadales bacterium]|jgi:tRNA pseudouridine32 synthase/23S rRNA pseudouridine746 synthase|nr:tRNA pseudouridine32 synthase / rRNA pseudouridine746 synthase [Sphingomonadales bacterium]